ncbi:hypothetical protein HKBW3S03_02136, partial [Candidatus Hakubella thermalkaliphila]
MGRGLIQKRKALRAQLFFPPHAKEKDYPVLSFLSEGYPGLLGRLPTRYSPVRRYPKSKLLGPLDLHVLSTPPAFVLSQDQTLHEKCQDFSAF